MCGKWWRWPKQLTRSSNIKNKRAEIISGHYKKADIIKGRTLKCPPYMVKGGRCSAKLRVATRNGGGLSSRP